MKKRKRSTHQSSTKCASSTTTERTFFWNAAVLSIDFVLFSKRISGWVKFSFSCLQCRQIDSFLCSVQDYCTEMREFTDLIVHQRIWQRYHYCNAFPLFWSLSTIHEIEHIAQHMKDKGLSNPVGNIPITFFLKQTKASTISFLLRLQLKMSLFLPLSKQNPKPYKKRPPFWFWQWDHCLGGPVSQILATRVQSFPELTCGVREVEIAVMWDKHTESSFLNTTCAQLIQRPELINNHLSLNLNNAKVISPIYNPKQGSKVIFFTWKKYFWNALIKSI